MPAPALVSQWQTRGANIATVHAAPTSLKVLKKCMLTIQGMVQNKEIGLLKLFEEAAVECRLIWSCLRHMHFA